MVKFTYQVSTAAEQTVITANYYKDVTINGQLIPVGKHLVTFSGFARLSDNDRSSVGGMARDVDDEDETRFDGEAIVGPLWEKVNQCSSIIAQAHFYNTNADEDDWQGWGIFNAPFDTVDENGKKRIRLNFTVAQYGQESLNWAINYKVTATGDLAGASEIPEPPPTPPTPPPTSECNKERSLNADAITSGDQSTAVEGSKAVDGVLTTRWISPTPGTQIPWIIVIVSGQPVPICRVDIAWADGNSHPYKFDVDVSLDQTNWTKVLSNQQSSGTSTDFESYTFQPTNAKYVRITITQSIAGLPFPIAQISEIRVFGNT
jgi:F5/8 type C domain